ncbi:MAG: hypothetical protein WBG02_13570 [Candidatus Acidiferrum sp.]
MELDAGEAGAFGEEGFGIGHLEDFAEGLELIGGVLVVGLDDAIADPVAEGAKFFLSVRTLI